MSVLLQGVVLVDAKSAKAGRSGSDSWRISVTPDPEAKPEVNTVAQPWDLARRCMSVRLER